MVNLGIASMTLVMLPPIGRSIHLVTTSVMEEVCEGFLMRVYVFSVFSGIAGSR